MHIHCIISNVPRVDVLVDCCMDDIVVIWVLIRLFWCIPLQHSVSPDMVHVNCSLVMHKWDPMEVEHGRGKSARGVVG